nr:immunoglobulin light chain junction region [Macaca mulatta]MOW16715.1 immunoglobulin light chain junction region [Macaca mulatta]
DYYCSSYGNGSNVLF